MPNPTLGDRILGFARRRIHPTTTNGPIRRATTVSTNQTGPSRDGTTNQSGPSRSETTNQSGPPSRSGTTNQSVPSRSRTTNQSGPPRRSVPMYDDGRWGACCGTVHCYEAAHGVAYWHLVAAMIGFILSGVLHASLQLFYTLVGLSGLFAMASAFLLAGLKASNAWLMLPFLAVQALQAVLLASLAIMAIVELLGGSPYALSSEETLRDVLLLVFTLLYLVVEGIFFSIVVKALQFVRTRHTIIHLLAAADDRSILDEHRARYHLPPPPPPYSQSQRRPISVLQVPSSADAPPPYHDDNRRLCSLPVVRASPQRGHNLVAASNVVTITVGNTGQPGVHYSRERERELRRMRRERRRQRRRAVSDPIGRGPPTTPTEGAHVESDGVEQERIDKENTVSNGQTSGDFAA